MADLVLGGEPLRVGKAAPEPELCPVPAGPGGPPRRPVIRGAAYGRDRDCPHPPEFRSGDGTIYFRCLATGLRECAHCGQVCDGSAVLAEGGAVRNLCHPDDAARPDCYRRVTVYGEPLGALAGVEPKPSGILGIRK